MKDILKNKLYLKIFVLLFLAVVQIEFILAQSINFTFPEEVKENKDFEVSLKLIDFADDVYDVKIDIFSSDGERVSEIVDDEIWKTTYYYIQKAIGNNEEKDFEMKIEDYEGEAEIEIKIRNSKGTYKTFTGYKINVLENKKEEIKKEKEEISEEKETEELIYENKKIEKNYEIQVIDLNPKNIKSDISSENQEQNTGKFAVYGFVFFCGLLGVLFGFKKYRERKDGIV